MFGVQFYPTPDSLIKKMIEKVSFEGVNNVLDPSAGKGDILRYFIDQRCWYNYKKCYAIEIDDNLRYILMNKGINVIDSNFLEYDGMDQFDLILMNPPFKDGDKHLLKAIDVLYSGQIVCILNAETIRNPYSNSRKLLCETLEKLGADIEFHKETFVDAERKTDVEIALVYINKQQDIQKELFDGMIEEEVKTFYFQENDDAITKGDSIESLIERYKFSKNLGIKTIMDFYKHNKFIGQYLKINHEKTQFKNLDQKVKYTLNAFLNDLRKDYWRQVIKLDKIQTNLTAQKAKEIREYVEKNCQMEINRHNIETIIINLCHGYIDNIKQAIMTLFDDLTHMYSYYPECNNNKLHFNGWKTNDAYKINKKVIMPLSFSFDNWYIPYDKMEKLDDIDKVLSYFDGKKITDVFKITDALVKHKERTKSYVCSKIESDHFIITVYKKGTIHLIFKDKELLRKFNLFACKEKAWLPSDYGTKPKESMNKEEEEVLKNFETNPNEYKIVNDMGIMDIKNTMKMLM